MEEGEPRLPRCEGTEPGGGAGGRSRAPANGNRAPSTGAPRRAAGALSLRNPISFHAAFPPPHLPSNLVLSRLLGSKLPALPHRPLLSAAFPLRFSGSSPGTPRSFRPPGCQPPAGKGGRGGPFSPPPRCGAARGRGGRYSPQRNERRAATPAKLSCSPPRPPPGCFPPAPSRPPPAAAFVRAGAAPAGSGGAGRAVRAPPRHRSPRPGGTHQGAGGTLLAPASGTKASAASGLLCLRCRRPQRRSMARGRGGKGWRQGWSRVASRAAGPGAVSERRAAPHFLFAAHKLPNDA